MRAILLAGGLSLIFTLLGTRVAIRVLTTKGYGQLIRDDGPTTHHTKRGTPTMGGLVIIVSVVLAYLFAKLITQDVPSWSAVLLLFLMAFGMPALQLHGLPVSAYFWSGVALVLSYGAYVAEVFRAGIESVHPSQVASAEALGLSRGQTMRFVVVPQAVRRVVPPLLNDFVSLQKDTALVAVVGVFDAAFSAQDYANYHFNYTSYVVVLLTVPLARFTDWLQTRTRRRELAGALP